MFYKISNISKLETIEKEFGRRHKFPNLFRTKSVINGLKESTVSIINARDPGFINLAIWGLLPKDFNDEWSAFQNIKNTLNIDLSKVDKSDDLYYDALNNNRCIIITTGFFTYELYEGKLFPYHVHLKNHKPFGMAGVYNTLEDGFTSCAILVTETSKSFKRIPNLSENKPLVFKKRDFPIWLNINKSYEELIPLIQNHETQEFLSHPIKEQFYNDSGLYYDIIKSETYRDMKLNA